MSTFPARRPRRLRTTPAMRNLVAETQVRPSDLILPMFIVDGLDAPREIPSMPGVYQHTFDSLRRAAEEALEVFTINAATAMGLGAETGSLTPGKSADFAVWDIESPAELVYRIGFNPLHRRYFEGKPC